MPVSATPFSRVTSEVFSEIVRTIPRGTIFFAEDVSVPGLSREYVRLALSELARDGVSVIRVARGVFCYPRLDGNAKVIVPDPPAVAAALAARWRVRIAPCGEQAAYLSGLVPWPAARPLRYVSDGSEQHFNLQNGRRIEFVRRKSVKVFSFRSECLRNLVEGVRFLGPGGIGDSERGVIRRTLAGIPPEDLVHDLRLAPGWISDLFLSLRPS